ncbi:nuclear nucleic acid-binding protein C1D-like [Bombyx mandarina]|uniref:Nuclear nucleic acid-binding protein C1D n=2 Tax=Bombyx TaxID=7090 RepID=A0A8R2AND9_BOMMO|nr:nuclear nucleic acid-binding protein C1D [Bombyx mori]XP_028032116.1 nuclear nucleic acid-binding protein C1D-like [Bombyx mandarina]
MCQELNWDFKYGELAKDKDFVNNVENLKENLIEVQQVLDKLLPLKKNYDKMSLPAQIELDLFFVYTLNSLHWIHLRTKGIDPTKHPIKDELLRIKATMLKWQEVKDRQKRPTVNVEVAKRLVRNGLYDHQRAPVKQLNKRIKFSDNEE